MPVLVKLSASLRRFVPGYDAQEGLSLPHRPGLTVAGVLAELGIAPAEVKIIMVDGVKAELEGALADGQRLGLFPAVGGG
jgi:sulfur carrier protein ThiS